MYVSLLFAIASIASAAPLLGVDRRNAIPGKWIVKMKGDIATFAADDMKATLSNKPDYDYSMPGFRGFAGTLSDEELAQLQASDQVEYVQRDVKVHKMELVQQFNATWGLSRISHAKPNDTTYLYDSSAGTGTCAYVIDTGIDVTHPEFQGRASFVADYSGEETSIDGDGHGTHVAGTIGSVTWGVAKNTTLFAVRVLDSSGSGELSGVLAGMQFVITDAKRRQEEGQCPSGVVANMSMGGEKDQAMNDAAAAIVAAGIFLGAAAGNEATPVEYWSPPSEPSVCTVGATAANDTLIWWSNYGSLVDILAPGVDITSTWPGGRIMTLQGTSMAAPHVVGLAAYMLGLGAPVEGLCETLAAQAIKGAIDESTLPEGTPNLLVFNGADAGKLYGRRRIRV